METAPFYQVNDVAVLKSILESRLPQSSYIYNMTIMYPKFEKEMKFFTLEKALTSSTWIVVTYDREDYGKEINISAPANPIITKEIKDAFTNSKLLDWTLPYTFPETDREISPMIFEISAYLKGNPTNFEPGYLYCMNREEAKQIDVRCNDPEVIIKSLGKDLRTGSQFIYDTCRIKTEGSMEYIENQVHRNPSAGVYKNNQLISGAITSGNGLMGFLFTLKEFRNKGFGRTTMQALLKEQAEAGFMPCSAVEIKNTVSNEFHKKIGMKLSCIVDYIASTGRT